MEPVRWIKVYYPEEDKILKGEKLNDTIKHIKPKKIAVPSEGESLKSLISSTLGRSPFIIIYDSETKKFKSIVNSGSGLKDGSGLQAAKIIVHNNADVLLTREIGRKAYSVLMKEHVKIELLNTGGTVNSAVNKYLKKQES
jgi:predicted Fe-Mo cluster-binding NifX family protein